MCNADSKFGMRLIVMRKTLCLLSVLALLPMANAYEFTKNLSPTVERVFDQSSNKVNGVNYYITESSAGITSQTVFGYTENEWRGTHENTSLAGQVSFANGHINLQIGASASNRSGGNFAGLKFDMPSGVESSTLSFEIKKTTSWGTNFDDFDCKYVCNVYGFSDDGTSTSIGTWTKENAETSLTSDPTSVSIDLNLSGAEGYSDYGLIFNAMETSDQGSGAGVAVEISNIQLSGEAVPEPATVSLGLLGLGAILLRRRRS